MDSNAETNADWIQLTDEKSYSRLLYTNPVCFLTTVDQETKPTRNVMVISWLSATNNNGRFMISINKRRHSASILTSRDNADFVLSIPVAGMEDLVLDVGKVSGKWGKSKFSRTDNDSEPKNVQASESILNPVLPSAVSKRQKKIQLENGIDGLVAVRVGGVQKPPQNEHDQFAIHGTVTHMVCKIYQIVGGKEGNAIDDEHHLILAEVKEAYVNRDYWNEEKKQFQFQPSVNNTGRGESKPAPHLTFLGSQNFGYIVPTLGGTT
jgi:flavin reductase (DIM6/NTAB) family NADH-FMN oxidoreductase RutF